ncbi:MAG: NUDIX domain-containing protein [Dokdonia sp.]|jgi:nudix-type nucleoside diphosphatase (YffH/AdpP family)
MSDRVKNLTSEILSDAWYTLYKYTFEYKTNDGQWQTQTREAYDRGNGATILLYNAETSKILLTKQFRLPTYLNKNKSGLLIESCAGLLEGDPPEVCIKKEIREELGFEISKVKKIFECYMSPGAVTEIIHFFVGSYRPDMRVNEGGGSDSEQEDIEVLTLDFDQAYAMIATGEIKDAKTILLLQYAKIHGLV